MTTPERHALTPDHQWAIQPWPDSKWDVEGFPITVDPVGLIDRYWATFWLPIVGPTCTILASRLIDMTVADETPTARYIAASIGLGEARGKNCALANALYRLEQFNLLRRDDTDGTLRVRTHVRPLGPREHARLPEEMHDTHHLFLRLNLQRAAERKATV